MIRKHEVETLLLVTLLGFAMVIMAHVVIDVMAAQITQNEQHADGAPVTWSRP